MHRNECYFIALKVMLMGSSYQKLLRRDKMTEHNFMLFACLLDKGASCVWLKS
jgi:hypothetical protein